MKKKSKIFSESFIQDLIVFSEGFFSPEAMDELILLFENETKKHYFTSSSEANLHRILAALYDKVSFLLDCMKYPHHIETVVTIASNSNFLTDIVVRSPEYLYQVFNPDYLKTEIKEERIREKINEGTAKYKTINGRVNYLKLIKRRLILKIGLTDLLNLKSLTSITSELSVLAKSINAALFELCLNEVLVKYEFALLKKCYCLASLGKLGGGELNYSSDVDLILFFDKNSKIGKKNKKEYFEILSEAAQLFTQVSCDITEKGFAYRVDFRLRPDGRNSPICRTIGDYTRYYETRGEDWERQMLIKLDFTAGDQKLYQRFTDYLASFVYPASFSLSPTEQIRKMKSSIEKRIEDEGNIKLVPGGIRDIEFSVQALQLMNGGKHKNLRTGNTLKAIEALAELNLLEKPEADVYNAAYEFYRRVEHYLQLMNDRQTHTIPAEGEMLEKLSAYMNFKNSTDFKQKIESFRMQVKSIFESIISSNGANGEAKESMFTEIKFADQARANKNIDFLRTGIGLLQQKMFDKKSISLFSEIEEALSGYLKTSNDPDKVLENISRTISRVQFPSIWYGEFRDQAFFENFLNICEFSQRAIDFLTSDKSLGEFILSRKIYRQILNYAELSVNQLLFIFSAQYALKLINQSELSTLLSDGLKYKLNQVEVKNAGKLNYFIAALGSFGTGEMNYDSDIDLIVVAEELLKETNAEKVFQNYLAVVKENLKPFDVDFRLRPEGKNSPLVCDLKNYRDYLKKRARIWEFQAFLKLKFVSGDKKLFNEFQKSVVEFLPEDKDVIRLELLAMSKKLQQQTLGGIGGSFHFKKSRGGIQTIDFIVHFLLMCNKKYYDENMGKKLKEKLEYLSNISSEFNETMQLIKCYENFREAEISIQNIFGKNSCAMPADKNQKEMIAHFSGFGNAAEFSNEILKLRKIVNSLFDKYLGK